MRKLHKDGYNPGSSGYAKKIKAAILDHFKIQEENLSDGKLANYASNSAAKINSKYDTARSIDKLISRNKVRHF